MLDYVFKKITKYVVGGIAAVAFLCLIYNLYMYGLNTLFHVAFKR